MEGTEKRNRVARLAGKCRECHLPIEEGDTLCFFHTEVHRIADELKREMEKSLKSQKNKAAIFDQKKERMGFRKFGLPRDIVRMIWNFVFESSRFYEVLVHCDANDPLPDVFDALLFNKNIWQKWWMEDFSDFGYDLSSYELPTWAVKSTNSPWRKYYLHSRFLRIGMGRLGMWLVRQKISDRQFEDLKYGFGDWKLENDNPENCPVWKITEPYHRSYFSETMAEYAAARYDETRFIPLGKAIHRYFDLRPYPTLRKCGPIVLVWVLLKYLKLLPADLIDESQAPHEKNYGNLLFLELHISGYYDRDDVCHGKIFESLLLWYMSCVQKARPDAVVSSINYYAIRYDHFSSFGDWTELRNSTEINTFGTPLRHNRIDCEFFM